MKSFLLTLGLFFCLISLEVQAACPSNFYARANWPVTQNGNYAVGVCQSRWEGSPLRLCQANGVWSSSVVNHCTRISCPSVTEGNATWAQTFAGNPRVGTCLPGFGGRVERNCADDGQWTPIVGECARCYDNHFGRAFFPGTPASSYSYGTCDEGWEGAPYRWCEPGGVWQTYIWDVCTRITCNATNEENAQWPTTDSSNFAQGVCNEGFVGSPTRRCQEDGFFGPVIDDPCLPITTCPAVAEYGRASWPETESGKYATGSCISGWQGSPKRQCRNDGTWSTNILNHCTRTSEPPPPTAPLTCERGTNNGNECNCTNTGYFGPTCSWRDSCQAIQNENNAYWPKTLTFTTAWGTCLSGFLGQPFRTCQADTTFGPISSPCVPASNTCPPNNYANAMWPETQILQSAIGTCVSGYSGSPSRTCKIDSTWSSNVVNHCQRNTCPPVTEDGASWARTNSLTQAVGTCLPGTSGSITRSCQADGTWGPTSGSCVASGNCPTTTYARAEWPETSPGALATGTCIPGWEGTPRRGCLEDGTWKSYVVNHCTRIVCPASNDGFNSFPPIEAGSTKYGTCVQGTGRPFRSCDINGNLLPVQNSCTL